MSDLESKYLDQSVVEAAAMKCIKLTRMDPKLDLQMRKILLNKPGHDIPVKIENMVINYLHLSAWKR